MQNISLFRSIKKASVVLLYLKKSPVIDKAIEKNKLQVVEININQEQQKG
jgi:hypothetical protein